jgi:hypothetical protein
MNITTIGNIPSTNWKRIKGQTVFAVTGVALALSAIVGYNGLTGSVSRPDTANVAVTQRQASQADIDAGVLSSEMATYDWTVAAPRQASQADIMASVLSTELANFGAPVAPVQPADVEHYGMGQKPLLVSPPASQADIMAGVLSTELANFAAPAQRVAAEADITAGVLSSELANFIP